MVDDEQPEPSLALRSAVQQPLHYAWITVGVLTVVVASIFGLFWLGYAGALPWDASTTRAIVDVLAVAAVLLAFFGLRHGGAALMAAAGYGKDFNIFVVWFFVPFAALMPVVGTWLGLKQARKLFRGTIEGGTVSVGNEVVESRGDSNVGRVGWPVAWIYVLVCLAWPGLLVSAGYTDFGMPGTVDAAPMAPATDRGGREPATPAAKVCSHDGGAATPLTLVNETRRTVHVFWVDARCQEHDYGTLKPGQQRRMNSYVGHLWRIYAGRERLVEHRAAAGGSTIVARP